MKDNDKIPEWVPKEGGTGFTCKYVDGVETCHDGFKSDLPKPAPPSGNPYKRSKLTVDDYVDGIMNGNRAVLGRAITLVESNAQAHLEMGQEVLKRIMPHTGNSIRLGISGVPGVGKSTFIEAFGTYLLNQGYRPAVLAIDPSSTITGGSILGDKTRMETLCRDTRCFIRPSPSGGTLGGVARKTRETMLVCEASGFDVIIVETVGVGQSEVTVRSMVDFFLLLMLAGAGDELQGIKRGIIEIADALLINKADGNNKMHAEIARNEYERALQYLQPATEGWKTGVYTCSAKLNEGIDAIWNVIEDFRQSTRDSGVFQNRRRAQILEWVYTMVDEHLHNMFFRNPHIKEALPGIKRAVTEGVTPPTAAVQQLIDIFEKKTAG